MTGLLAAAAPARFDFWNLDGWTFVIAVAGLVIAVASFAILVGGLIVWRPRPARLEVEPKWSSGRIDLVVSNTGTEDVWIDRIYMRWGDDPEMRVSGQPAGDGSESGRLVGAASHSPRSRGKPETILLSMDLIRERLDHEVPRWIVVDDSNHRPYPTPFPEAARQWLVERDPSKYGHQPP